MPRDASGNYTLPAGNPVVAGTTITATWANATMPDIGNEITDSLSRSGQGGMLVPLRVADGSVTEPAYSFSNEITLGMYRAAAADMRFAAAGDQARVNNTNQLEVLRDYGGGLTWYPVADSISAFDAKLAGYADTGHLGERYQGNLDDLLVNSTYEIRPAEVTNEPSDMTFKGILETRIVEVGNNGQQIIYGYATDNQWKIWMRTYEGSAWGAWKLVVDGGAFPQRLDGLLDTGFKSDPIASLDLNSIEINSEYLFATATATNIPSDLNGASNAHVRTRKGQNANNTQQMIYGMQATDDWRIWIRSEVAGTWSAWKLVVDGGAFTLRLAGYGDDGRTELYTGDADLVILNSMYVVTEGQATNLPADMASGATGFLVNMRNHGSSNTQILYTTTLDFYKQWQRQSNGAVWDAWKLVVDGGAFTQRLDGYADTGVHEAYTGDLDVIAVNSVYSIRGSEVTNEPADFGDTRGFIVSQLFNTNNITQTIYGLTSTSAWKQWMRVKEGGVWGAWKLVVDGGAFPLRLAGYLDTGLGSFDAALDIDAITMNSMQTTFTGQFGTFPSDFVFNDAGILISNFTNLVTGVVQILYGAYNANQWKQWQRTKDAGVWGAWKLVVDGGVSLIGFVSSAGTLLHDNGGVSAVRDAVGVYTLTFNPALDNTSYNPQLSLSDTVAGFVIPDTAPAVGSLIVRAFNAAGAAADLNWYYNIKPNP